MIKIKCFFRDKNILSTVLCGLITLCFFNGFLSANQHQDYYKNPNSILKNISNRGVTVVISEIYSKPSKWDFVLRHIASGEKNWLYVAVALRSDSDSGASEMLELSVGEALENKPENVFNIALKIFQLEEICGGPDVDDERYNSYELSISAIDRRIKKVSSINCPNLKKTCIECKKLLEESKANIAAFFGKSKKHNESNT